MYKTKRLKNTITLNDRINNQRSKVAKNYRNYCDNIINCLPRTTLWYVSNDKEWNNDEKMNNSHTDSSKDYSRMLFLVINNR